MGSLIDNLGKRPYIDANVVVYAVEGFPEYRPVVEALLRAMDAGELVAVTSELTVAEVLVRPLRSANAGLVQAYNAFLEPTAALRLESINRSVLVRAAEIRATTGLRLPDAIHAATALEASCSALLTNDQGLRQFHGVPVRLVSELLASA